MAAYISTWLDLTAIILARYVAIAGLFYVLLWKRPAHKVRARRLAARPPDRRSVGHEVRMSALSSAIYAVPGTIVMHAFEAGGTAIYTDVLAIGGGGALSWLYIPVSMLIYLLINDAYFYWSHRAMHHKALFHATHLAHHRSRQPSPWAAFSFHPWEAVISAWVLPLAAFLIPIHVGAVLALLVTMTYCSVANHAGWEILPKRWVEGRVGRAFISASHHNVHHTDYGANFGLYFRFWDLVCGTDRGLAAEIKRPQTDAAQQDRPALAPAE